MMTEKNVKDRLKLGDIVEESGFFGSGSLAQELVDHTLWTDETSIELQRKPNSRTTRFYSDDRNKVP